MSKTVKIWNVFGGVKGNEGHCLTFYAATRSDADRIIDEYDIAEPLCHELEIPLTRYGIAQALQDVVDGNCLNDG